MNQNSSYVVPNYPKINDPNKDMNQPSHMPNQQMIPNKNNLNKETTKHLLFFSNYCNHSKELLGKLNKNNILQSLDIICIDNRFVKNNITYITLTSNQNMPLPPMINSVPTLCILPNHEILKGKQIIEYFNPVSKNIQEEREKINLEPDAFSLCNETTHGYGVSSDSFSFWDTNPEDLSASGNGGMRQMYNHVSIHQDNETGSIYTPNEEIKENKMKMTLEQLQQQRQNEI